MMGNMIIIEHCLVRGERRVGLANREAEEVHVSVFSA